MNEFTTPDAVEIAEGDNVIAALLGNAKIAPNRPALAYRDGDKFIDVSTAEFASTVRELAAGLIGLGIEPGDRVCIFMKTRIEFTYADYAIWCAGATAVTIYETSSAEQVEWIVSDSGAVAIICGNADLRSRFESISERTPDCRHVFTVGEGAMDALRENAVDVDQSAVDERLAGIRHSDLAALVYTSGTTGQPKGCMITHGNFIFEVRQVVGMMDQLFNAGGSTLMFLPLAHILARVVQVGCVTRGVKIGYSSGLAQLVPELSMFNPGWVFAVPRVFEKFYNTAQSKAGDGMQRKVFDRAVDVAVRYSRESAAGNVGLSTKLQHAVFDKLVYAKLRAAFGGQLKYAISGGAPLGERLGHFFNGAGVLILEGYGLTETTAAATINTPHAFKIGTVGRPIPGSSAKIAEDGEVLLRGGMVFDGYWHNESATVETLIGDGWFASGDIGKIDDDGYLSITGRKKELIVTAAGKNVAPAVLEDFVRAHPLVSQVMVVGDQQPFIAAVVTLDAEELTKWADSVGAHSSAPSELIRELLDDDNDALRAEIQTAIDDANAQVSRAESIREFRILSSDFTIESGELTPTMKLKRTTVMQNHATVIQEIYGG